MVTITSNVQTESVQPADLLAAVADCAALAGPAADAIKLDTYLQQQELIGVLSGELEFAGLQTASLVLQDYLELRYAQDEGVDDQLHDALISWPQRVRNYLISPPGTGAVEALIDYLHLPLWDPPLMPEDAQMLRELLREERPIAAVEEVADFAAGPHPCGPSAQDSKSSLALHEPSGEVPELAQTFPSKPEEHPKKVSALRDESEDISEAVPALPNEPEGVSEAVPALPNEPEGVSEAAPASLDEPEGVSEAVPALLDEPEDVSEAVPALLDEPEEVSEAAPTLLDEPEDYTEAVPTLLDTPETYHELAPACLDESEQYPETASAIPEPSNADLPPQIAELVMVLQDELPLVDESLEKLLQVEMSSSDLPAARQEAAELYADYLDRFADAAESVGFLGLRQVVAIMRENLDILVMQPRPFSDDESELLASWSAYASLYLSDPYGTQSCQSLIDWLNAPQWPRPLVTEPSQALLALLQAPTLLELELEPDLPARPRQATTEQASLTLPDDVNQQVLEALLQELPIQTQTFSQAIQNLIAGGALEDVKVAQRTAHTVKGASNTVGVPGLANLTHHLEDILAALAKQEALPHSTLALSLMNAADCLETMCESLCGMGEPPDNAQAMLQEVLDWANRIDREGLPEADAEAPPTPPDSTAETEQSTVSAETVAVQSGPSTAACNAPAPAAKTRVAIDLVDDLLRLGGETIILGGQVHEQVRRISARVRSMEIEFERLQQLGGELERLIDIRDLSSERSGQDGSSQFDPLEMDQYNELHTTSRMLVEAATDARQMGGMVKDKLHRLDTMLLTQERLQREAQETVLSARMVPINTVLSRLQRSVRQTCRLTGKQVQLQVSGADTLMDGEVLNELIDPLMHVLRNAVDHGIEPVAQRTAVGKPDSGTIQLDFLREGNNILVRCRDDGAGLDYPAIRRAAETRGLLEPGKAVLEEELRDLLLMPNFSTRSKASQTSGRGVGLDIVYSHVVSQGGSLALKSETGKGSSTELRLPVSLISTHALLVRVRGQVMAVADRGIERILHTDDGVWRTLGDQLSFQMDDGIYPLRQLEHILRLEQNPQADQPASMPVLLVRTRTGISAVAVQEVLAGTDLVVKEFGCYLPRLPGIVGATILGDGTVTPVLDLPEMMSAARGNTLKTPLAMALAADEVEQAAPALPLALVVDDSLSARRALAQVMADAGYEVREARDGHEAVQQVEGQCPDIVLADMEMPRMNGIELTAHLRAHQETAELPVIMISSRSTAKHRQQAESAGVDIYLTKPFQDDQLLDHVAVLRGQI